MKQDKAKQIDRALNEYEWSNKQRKNSIFSGKNIKFIERKAKWRMN